MPKKRAVPAPPASEKQRRLAGACYRLLDLLAMKELTGEKIKVGISACLLGEKVRYDGGHKLDHYLKETLGQYVEWVPVCPEVEYGLPVPREALRLVGDPRSPRLLTTRTGIDHTDGMLAWARQRSGNLEDAGLCGFVFKSRSPSSGMGGVKVYGSSGIASKSGIGIFARVFIEHFPLLPVEDDGRLQDPALRENFIERIFVLRRWRNLIMSSSPAKDLVSFHTDHKLLILAHSPKHYSVLGRLVAEGGKRRSGDILGEYIPVLMEALRMIATPKKNTNVLQHSMGYFKKQLSPDEKQELAGVIEQYRRGLIPLIAPLVLLNHYVRKYHDSYLLRQHYLNPHPVELMLRNHV